MTKNIMIVGGGSGIGKSTVEDYLSKQFNVTVFDKSIDDLRLLIDSNPKITEKLLVIQGDVRNNADISKAIEQTEKTFGYIDVLVYSAGVYPDQKLLSMNEDDWDGVLDVNLKGAFLFGKKIAQGMIENTIKGHIITISSGSYRSARVGSAHYCTSKAGLVMLTKVMAMEFAQYGIKVNSIAPGLIENPILDPSYKEQFVNRIPAGRIGMNTDISSFIVSLTTLNNDYLTGQVIGIDGALSTGQYGLVMSNKS